MSETQNKPATTLLAEDTGFLPPEETLKTLETLRRGAMQRFRALSPWPDLELDEYFEPLRQKDDETP
ncbi:MAG: hypothetical protein LBR29_02275 [Methylobacteriaceae bacterium]|nr:hypothetical protein [Methylobacteriaceae bacterium]